MKKKAQFLVVGDGPRMEAARSQVEGLGLAGRVHFAGSIPAKKMADYYSAMDIFAAPTIDRPADMPDWKEQCPRAHVEAMLSGLAMVASDGGENRWTIGNAGIIVPRANPSALAGALDRLCANSRLRRSLGKKARSRAVANFTWEKAAQGLVKIWRKLPEKRG